MKKFNWQSLGIGGGGGVLAALCCLGPLFIIFLGLGSVSVALGFSQYRAYFWALSFVFILAAIWVYLKKKGYRCTYSKETLKAEKYFLMGVVISAIGVYSLINYLVLPAFAPKIYQGMKGAQESVLNQASSSLRRLELGIEGMYCPSCAPGIEQVLEELEGVKEASVSYAKGTGKIIYDPKKINQERIVKALPSPYSAQVIKDEKLQNE